MDTSSPAPRRSQRIAKLDVSPTTSTFPPAMSSRPAPTPNMAAARRSPYLPSGLEIVLLLVYPATLLVGSLFGLLDPNTRASPYNPTTQAHFVNTAPSYFAKKSNLFNQLFVKKGWAWVTFSYLFFLFTHPSAGAPLAFTTRRIQGLTRYTIVTILWLFVTQWFFGPAIIDRSFVLTGGQCELVQLADHGKIEMDETRQFVTGVACKAVGGQWAGGHDISGHVFLLVLGSMFLFEELIHVVKSKRTKEERTVYMHDGGVRSAGAESGIVLEQDGEWTIGARIVLGVGSLSVYMLLMTAAYFHTWFEKLTGLLVAFSGVFVVYYLPRVVPALRAIVGMPGV